MLLRSAFRAAYVGVFALRLVKAKPYALEITVRVFDLHRWAFVQIPPLKQPCGRVRNESRIRPLFTLPRKRVHDLRDHNRARVQGVPLSFGGKFPDFARVFFPELFERALRQFGLCTIRIFRIFVLRFLLLRHVGFYLSLKALGTRIVRNM